MRIAIIGCGSMGLRHSVALAELRKRGLTDFELVAVCDIDESRASELAFHSEKIGHQSVAAQSSYERILDDHSIDAVSVVLPTWLHHIVGCEALLAGKHTIIEKPLAISPAASSMLRKAAERSNRVLAVAENYRRIPSNRAFRSLVGQRKCGTPLSMFVQRVASPDESYKVGDRIVKGASWYREPAKAGSYHVFELGAHEIDLQQFWFGPIVSVTGTERTIDGVHNRTLIQMQFASGMLSQVAFVDSTTKVEFTRRRFTGTQGMAFSRCWHAWQDGELFVDGVTTPLEEMTESYLRSAIAENEARFLPDGSFEPVPFSDPTNPLTYGVGAAYADFAAAIQRPRNPEIGIDEGSDVVAVGDAILTSIAEQRTVSIDRNARDTRDGKVGR
ncbi:Gfo/Idh/MocA family oxidoreductase [Pararhizobium sp. YC-54]|uniref:Gfo/Idh/MocA family protein n=1 Tax=Pararhizobium sp. YC-54 TaxID=2986920 RepID=UPI0021F6CB3C|nr:Gfo/Idh/MocA family oxidoreductase [Pararhizobium sp. YC-54]MCV9999368.1 Gfo/Idh/MocA family oxidoreductase [Pararhizobium sp. YC-54]